MLEELGPTFIKLGQVLSSRPDLVHAPYIAELKQLQDHCEPLPFARIKESIQDGLGQPSEELFASIESAPIATASIAQVHEGRTLDGARVVIKVQRPGIKEEVRRDLDLLYRIAQVLEVIFAEAAMVEPLGIVREFDAAFTEELNFQREAANVHEFARLHDQRPHIAIPTVIDHLSTSTILTLSYLDGTPLSRLPPEADRRLVAQRVIEEAFEQVFVDGVFHADPHPGNLLYLGDDRYRCPRFWIVGATHSSDARYADFFVLRYRTQGRRLLSAHALPPRT